MKEIQKTLILGFGNPDRGDDGVAWYILSKIAAHFNKSLSEEQIECCLVQLNDVIHLWFNLQLIPEISEQLANYKRAIFIDAHTVDFKEDIRVVDLKPEFQNSPFTHHLTPSSCLSLTQSIFGRFPMATLISVRGYSFEFINQLSKKTHALADTAVEIILHLLE
jgi:hydrogenase maturation protease